MANQLHSLPRIIVLESEHAQEGWPKAVYKGNFINKDVHIFTFVMVKDVGHYCWLHGPMNHLLQEQQLTYITKIM